MRYVIAMVLSVMPAFLWAHPHVFVDTRLKVAVDAKGQLQGVEVSWTYDDFFSFLVLADLGLDPDGDGALTAPELDQLAGFDMNWQRGFKGDVYLSRGARNVRLGPPQPRRTTVENGRITTTHFRPARGAPDGLVIKAYDPTFYTAYTVVGDVPVSGSCTASITPANLDKAYTLVEELLYAIPADQVEEAYPEVGESFADTVTIRCP